MLNYLLRHAQVLLATLGQMVRAPLASLLTLTVIGITLALPSGLYVLLNNLQQVSAGWDRGAQASLFLKDKVTEAGAQELAQKIRALPAVTGVTYLSREAALQEFRQLSGFGAALSALNDNPLPAVLVVRLKTGDDPAVLNGLVSTLKQMPGVDLAQLDIEWLQRLAAILQLAERAVIILATLLSLAVLLIIGNTIRLAVVNRQTEIEIIQLVGGTPAFVRRPFLYTGILQGLTGGLFAWLLVETSLFVLSGPARDLAGLYGSHYALAGLGAEQGLSLTLLGGLLGGVGARLAVSWQLRQMVRR